MKRAFLVNGKQSDEFIIKDKKLCLEQDKLCYESQHVDDYYLGVLQNGVLHYMPLEMVQMMPRIINDQQDTKLVGDKVSFLFML